MRRWMGLKDLVVDAVEKTTDLVQETHESVTRRTMSYVKMVEPLEKPAELIDAAHTLTAGTVYASIRITNRAVSELIDLGVRAALPGAVDAESAEPAPLVDAAIGALNGVVGDFLAERGNALDLAMELKGERASGRVCVFVHGLACTDQSWFMFGPDSYGDRLERELAITPLYLRYNSGKHISENGRLFDQLLDELADAEEIVLIGHSMGGLVARSACHYGAERGARWVDKLRHVFCLGSPHLGAPLEKAGNVLSYFLGAIPTAGTQVPAKIINARSAGIKDLRYGYTVDDEWNGKDADALLENHRQEIPFIDHATYYFVAATITEDPRHPVGALIGDTLVRLPSAKGTQRFDLDLGMTVGRTPHVALCNHPEVYAQIAKWLAVAG